MKRNYHSVRACGLLLTIAACGAGCNGGGAATLTQGSFCDKMAENECAAVANKCLATSANCKTKRVAACNDFAMQQQAAPSSPASRPFRPENADACLTKTTTVYSKSTITPVDLAALDDVCARVFSGKKKSTDTVKPTCASDYECDDNEICDPDFIVCAPKKMVGTSAGCNNPGEICPAGQYCTGSPRQCKPRPAAGEACDATSPCLETLRCGSAGTCVERLDIGASCDSNDDCDATYPYCDPYNGKVCTPGFTPSTANAECVSAFGAANPNAAAGGV